MEEALLILTPNFQARKNNMVALKNVLCYNIWLYCLELIKGRLVSANKVSACDWKEIRPNGKHSLTRSLKLTCLCSSAKGAALSYTCEYRGEPHKLGKEYNNGGQPNFYKSIAHFAAGI